MAWVVAVSLSACGGGGATQPTAQDVLVKNIAFTPATLDVASGTEVTWTTDDEGVAHTITSGRPGDVGVPGVTKARPGSPTGMFNGELAAAGQTFSFTFDELGTFDYYCAIHPSMTGRVNVR